MRVARFFFSSRRRHTRCYRDWSSDVCSSDLSQLEGGRGGYMPRYGLMHCLACFTLFDRDPQLVNTILEGFLEVTPAQVQAAAQKYLVRRNRAIVIRRPVAKGAAR